MNVYNIAGLNVGLDCQKRTMERAEKYKVSGFSGKVDFSIITTPEEIAAINSPEYTEEIKAYLRECKIFYQKLIEDYNGMMIHSSAVVVDDKAYLFSAPSGTGKSTHTALWLKKFGGKAYILNDDKPAIRIIGDQVFAYGTPWSGKDDISVNKKVPIQGICFIKRDETNWIKPMSSSDAVVNLYHSSIKKVDREIALKIMDIISMIIERVPIYQLGCTPTVEAAEMAYKIMSRGL